MISLIVSVALVSQMPDPPEHYELFSPEPGDRVNLMLLDLDTNRPVDKAPYSVANFFDALDMVKFYRARDAVGLAEMVGKGTMAWAEMGAQAHFIKRHPQPDGYDLAEVRLVDGNHRGKLVWVLGIHCCRPKPVAPIVLVVRGGTSAPVYSPEEQQSIYEDYRKVNNAARIRATQKPPGVRKAALVAATERSRSQIAGKYAIPESTLDLIIRRGEAGDGTAAKKAANSAKLAAKARNAEDLSVIGRELDKGMAQAQAAAAASEAARQRYLRELFRVR